MTDVSALWAATQWNLDAYGALGMAFGLATGLMPRRELILFASAAAGTCFAAHFYVLGSPTGTAMNLISVVQSLVAACLMSARQRPSWIGGFFAATLVAVLAITAWTWTGWPSAFAAAGTALATVARLQHAPQRMRQIFLAASLCWVCHNLVVGSICGLACDLLTVSAFAGTMLRQAARERAGGRNRAADLPSVPVRQSGLAGDPAIG
jgi:hypothetical protein